MAEKMQELAPELWDLLGLMLTANSREAWRKTEADAEGDKSCHDHASGLPQQHEFAIDMGRT